MPDALALINAEIDQAQQQLDGIRARIRDLREQDLEPLITAEELAIRVGVEPSTVLEKARSKKWPSFKDGQIIRFSYREVKEALRK